MVDTDRIKKLLKLTTSTYNGEALNAIRKANEEINRSGQTWDDVLEGKGKVSYCDKIFTDQLERSNMVLVRERDTLLKSVNRLQERLDVRLKEASKFESENIFLKAEIKDLKGEKIEAHGKKYKGKGEYIEAELPYSDQYGRYVPKSKRERR